ncbi:hypothetical protein P3H15_11320 [Rhodococcus sp. T2V]|uniref:hypothetical protein n=1 Tax=Rhodococcus sp. T2V TaxID=3034164 RepID=UPI0023E2D0DE|nr:hypothetical protein [Rhodococcus sp. T2V]MDF3305610.1 hypothetical protein [Rhodococcus sp. T2V]
MTRLDRTGEPVDEHEARASSRVAKAEPAQVRPPHNPDCRSGWLGADLDDRPIPCLQCRPHLARIVNANDNGVTR